MGSSLRRVIVPMLLGVMAAGVLAGIPRAADAAVCTDVFFVGARGSGQTGADFNGYGEQVVTTRNMFVDRMIGGKRTTTSIAIEYPSRHVRTATYSLSKYFEGLEQGVTETLRELRTRGLGSVCPRERIVLSGYSQGAMVMHRVLDRLRASGTTADQAILDRIDGVILLADGDRVPDDRGQISGTASRQARGIGYAHPGTSGANQQRFPSSIADSVISVCMNDDIVCDHAPTNMDPIYNGGIHTSSAYKGSVYVMIAVNYVAERVLRHPRTAPGNSNSGKIYFVSGRDGNSEIYRMNADGSGQTRLTRSTSSDLDPAVSPNGSKVAFTRWQSDTARAIYVMNSDGSGQTRLTNNSYIGASSWSPDGSKIAYGCDGRICIMNASGSGKRVLVGGDDPSWSPDGSRIAYDCGNVCVVNINGSGKTNIGGSGNCVLMPSWSPDGSRISYNGSTAESPFECDIFVMNANGSNARRLTPSDFVDDFGPTWSPDGSRIAFSSSRGGSHRQVYVMNADGSNQRALTSNRFNSDPSWTPR